MFAIAACCVTGASAYESFLLYRAMDDSDQDSMA